jgi:hypothetical protein
MKYTDVQNGMEVKKVNKYRRDIDWAFGEPANEKEILADNYFRVTRKYKSYSGVIGNSLYCVEARHANGYEYLFHPRELSMVEVNLNEVE